MKSVPIASLGGLKRRIGLRIGWSEASNHSFSLSPFLRVVVMSGDVRTIPATDDDVRLVELSRDGNCEAFGRIVERYQSLICALTYNACGNLQTSEDLAQVTFITAWCQLASLREPAKLKAWLCRIARNVAVDSFRRQQRTPTARAEELNANLPTDETSPRDVVIGKEEQAVMWRVLDGMPPTYREPLILFYRQEQSVAEMADALELSEDAVKQRLSRGRELLSERTAKFIETALRTSAPSKAFTLGVLAALPAMATSSKAAVLGATVGASKAAASVGLAGAILGPVIGLLGGWFGAKMSIENTQSARERQFMIKMVKVTLALVGVFLLAVAGLVLLSLHWWKTHPTVVVVAFVGTLLGYVVTLVVLILWCNREQARIRREEPPGLSLRWPVEVSIQPIEYRSRWTLLGLPVVHVRLFAQQAGKRQPAKGWIAIGDVAYGALLAVGCAWAVAPVSFGGGFAIGGLAFGGGFAVGLLAVGGGLSLGAWALGGGIGIRLLAFGGAAIGWTAATGGEIAPEFVRGGLAVAKHVNDEAAKAFSESSGFFQTALATAKYARWLGPAVGVMLVCLVFWRIFSVRRRNQA